jgi:hypothetical protein
LRFSVEKNTQPPGFDQARAGGDDGRRVGHVLEHFHAGDDVEFAGVLRGKILGRHQLVVDLLARFVEVQLGDLERLVREVDAADGVARAGHRLGEDAAAAADVEHLLAGERRQPVDPFQAQRIDLVQRLELGVRVPPAVGEFGKFGDFGGVNVAHH